METRARPCLVLIACILALAPAGAWPERLSAADAAEPVEELIATIRSNGVALGEFTVLQSGQGDYWVQASDLDKLRLQPQNRPQRQHGGIAYYSLRELGASRLSFDAATLELSVDFPAGELRTTRVDLSSQPKPLEITTPRSSTIVNYRASVTQGAAGAPVQLRLATELNFRIGETLLRQEARLDAGGNVRPFTRGATQVIWDNRRTGRRVTGGDQLTRGGPFGTVFPAVGLSLTRDFGITPDVLRQPTANLQVVTGTPSQVEVSVDGATVYRNTVGPGPISLENLYYYGGTRIVRVTVTDAVGRREVVEQPFFFTDTVLARGVHDYGYFLGRRAELGLDDRWRYRENAWQGFHRFGVTDSLTIEGGAEGSADFASGGAGLALRSDKAGLLSVGLLRSTDRAEDRNAGGWSARYLYATPNFTFFASGRQLGRGFRSFETAATSIGLLTESRLGASARLGQRSNIAFHHTRRRDRLGRDDSYSVRLSSYLSRRTSVFAEYTHSRLYGQKDWSVNLYARMELDPLRWAGTTVRAGSGFRSLDIETGKQLLQGEGFGYRVGTSISRLGDVQSQFAYGSATWNLERLALDFNGSAQTRGGGARYFELGASGAIVALDGYVGAARPVADSFALAQLGVPQADVDIFLNSQLQGRTDAAGQLLIPNLGAFGRQDLSLNDKQLSMEYNIARRRVAIAPAYKSGTVVAFGGTKLRAVTGRAWLLKAGERTPVSSRAWTLAGPSGRLQVETTTGGEFYFEEGLPGRYAGSVQVDGRTYACRLDIPDFPEAVHELQEGIICE